MTLKHRLLLGASSSGMVGGSVLLLAAGLTFIRPGLTGFLADIVPNLPIAPFVPIVGAALIIGGARARRRLLRSPEAASLPRHG